MDLYIPGQQMIWKNGLKNIKAARVQNIRAHTFQKGLNFLKNMIIR